MVKVEVKLLHEIVMHTHIGRKNGSQKQSPQVGALVIVKKRRQTMVLHDTK